MDVLAKERNVRLDAFRVSEAVLVRVAGLPADTAEQLKCTWLDEALATSASLRRSIDDRAQQLTEELHRLVASVAGDPASSRALLAIKRDVFNGRDVSDKHLAAADDYLSGSVREALGEWRHKRAQLGAHERASEAALQNWLREKRCGELRRVAHIPDFRKALLTSSLAFERGLQSYLSWDGNKPDKRLRRAEHVLMSYLLRATYKPSPFSRLTSVCLGQFTDDTDAAMLPSISSAELCAEVNGNSTILARCRYAVAKTAAAFPNLNLSLKPGTAIVQGQVRYRRRSESILDVSGPAHAITSEYRFGLDLTPSLERIYDRLTRSGTATVAELRSTLVSELEMTDEDAVAYVQRLVDVNLLVPADFSWSVFDDHQWGRFMKALSDVGASETDESLRLLQPLERRARDYGETHLKGRQEIIASMERDVDAAIKAIDPSISGPRPVLYEDVTLAKEPVSLGRRDWQEQLSDLAELQRLLSLFDRMLISKLSMNAIFKRSYGHGGTCKDLVDFSDMFHDTFYNAFGLIEGRAANGNPFSHSVLNPMRIPEISNILEARAELTEYFDRAFRKADETEVTLPSGLVAKLGAIAAPLHPVLSNSFFVQCIGDGASSGVVLNNVHGGIGSMMTRFCHLYRGADGNPLVRALRKNVSGIERDDTVLAEFQGGYETNLNQHPLTTSYEIVFPGERAVGPLEQQLALDDLYLKHDSASDRVQVHSARLGKRIVPVYAGMLFPGGLSELHTLLLHLASPVSFTDRIFAGSAQSQTTSGYVPRVRYKSVIVERAKWMHSLDELPRRENTEDDYSNIRRLDRWRTSVGVPDECFARMVGAEKAPASGESNADENEGAQTVRDKPFFVDFGNPLSVLMLERMMANRTGSVVFTELLPNRADPTVECNGNRHVAEFVIELTQTGAAS